MRPLIDQNAKEGKDKKVVFECGFSKPNCKPKWSFRKDVRNTGPMYNMQTTHTRPYCRSCSRGPSTNSRLRVIVIS